MKKLVVGLTGGIGSGKSAVLAMFRRGGVKTFDSDKLAREAVRPGRPAARAIRRTFGASVFKKGRLDRKALARLVFQDAPARKKLEKIVHPEVVRALKRGIAGVGSGLVVADIPLLFEARLKGLADGVAVVWAPRGARLERLARRGMPAGEARRRMAAQMPLERKRRLADWVIDNSGAPARTQAQVRVLARALKALLTNGAHLV